MIMLCIMQLYLYVTVLCWKMVPKLTSWSHVMKPVLSKTWALHFAHTRNTTDSNFRVIKKPDRRGDLLHTNICYYCYFHSHFMQTSPIQEKCEVWIRKLGQILQITRYTSLLLPSPNNELLYDSTSIWMYF